MAKQNATYNHPTVYEPDGRAAAACPPTAGSPSLDTEETSVTLRNRQTYRDFLVSGVKGDMQFAEAIYWQWDIDEQSHRHNNLLGCKSHAWFMIHKETKAVRVAASACGLRWCPLCIRTRKYIITESVKSWLLEREKPKFLTFTLKHHTAPLKEQIQALYKYFRAIRKTPFWKKHVKGGIWFFQVKKSKDERYWHPHIHVLIEGKYIIQKDLSNLWRKITHGSYVVDIRAVKNVNKAADYVARYAAAPCRLFGHKFDDALEIVKALHSQRICGTFGTAKGVSLRPTNFEDKDDWVQAFSWFIVTETKTYDEISKALWTAWVTNKPYEGAMPEPPPTIDEAFKKEMERPTSFNQMFFTYWS